MAFPPAPPLTQATSSFRAASINLRSHDQDSSDIRTVPELIEYNAQYNPNHPFCVQAAENGSTDLNLLVVTHLQLKQAILRCSTWLVANILELSLPQRSDVGKVVKGAPVALLMDSDIGILFHLLSLMGLGVPVMLLSARLSPVAIHHLLVQTSANAVIASPRLQRTAKEALSLFTSAEASPVLYTQIAYTSFLEPTYTSPEDTICGQDHYIGEADRNVLILHSSGTTGLPKAIYNSHRYLLAYTACHEFSNDDEALGLNVSTLPLYHGFGLVGPCLSLGAGKTCCIPNPSIIPTGASTVKLLKYANAHSLMSVPSILEEIPLLSDNEGTLMLRSLQFVACGGAPLKLSVGEELAAAGVKIVNSYGATETGPLTVMFVPAPEHNWHYFRLRRDMVLQLEAMPLSDGEMQRYKLTTRPFGWDTTFEVQDQLICNPEHPTSEFRAIGRTDDLIVLVTGEKVLPYVLESTLSKSAHVKTAIAFGDDRFELGVIVEPSTPLPVEEHGHFKSLIWPIIQEAGDRMDNHARISSKDAVVVVPPGRQIPRSDKGSVLRREVNKDFEAEIAEVYKTLDKSFTDNSIRRFTMYNLEQDLKDLIQTRLGWKVPDEDWNFDDDLFELGMDSLQAIRLRRFLLQLAPEDPGSSPAAETIPRDFVYRHPSITKIARVFRGDEEPNGRLIIRQETIERFVQLYSTAQPDRESLGIDLGFAEACKQSQSVVLLTGSTGSLGTHLLAYLASHPSVVHVICLNRPHPEDPYERQLKAAQAKDITIPQQAWSKIRIIQTNSAASLMGLSTAQYGHLCGQITHIIHNAWPMDFKRRLPSFEAHFRILQNLVRLARDAHKIRPTLKPSLLFVSSIGVVGQYGRVHGGRTVPEIPMDSVECTNPFGYGEAKLVCEKIIEAAAHVHHDEIQARYVRVGQVSGSMKTGFWNSNEHLPALIKSSQIIGAFPKLEGTCSWLPVDCAAEVLSELLLTTIALPTDLVYHLENPVRQSWHDILIIFASRMVLPKAEFLPFHEWLDKICAAAEDVDAADIDANPAKQLVDFFRGEFEHMSCGNVILDMERARKVSPALQSMESVSEETIAAYIDQWKVSGFLK